MAFYFLRFLQPRFLALQCKKCSKPARNETLSIGIQILIASLQKSNQAQWERDQDIFIIKYQIFLHYESAKYILNI